MTSFFASFPAAPSRSRRSLVGCAIVLALAASTASGHGGGFRGGGGGGRGGFGGGSMSRGGFSGGRPAGSVSRGPSMSPSRGGGGVSRPAAGPGGGGERPGTSAKPGSTGRPGQGPGSRGPGETGRGTGGMRRGPGGFAGDPLAHGGLSADRLRSLGRGTGATTLKGQSLATLENRGNEIRNNFYRSDWYGGRGWYGEHFNAWWPGRWYGGWGGWGVGVASGLLWADLAGWGGYGAAPIAYDYGTTVVYANDSVAVAGEDAGTPEEYSQQAAELAASGESDASVNDESEWRPLGVYALARDGETKPSTFISLAVDTSGLLRGNYYDAISDSTMNITGKVDQKTQRAAWTIGEHASSVYEAGLSNLLQDQTQVLVHRNDSDGTPTGNVEQMLLVRVDDGDDKASSS